MPGDVAAEGDGGDVVDASGTEDAEPDASANQDAGENRDAAVGFQPLCSPGDIVGHWRFEDDFNGNTIADVSGLYMNDILNEPPTPIVAPWGAAAQFPGPGPDQGFIRVKSHENFNRAFGSFEVWVRFDHSDAVMEFLARDSMNFGDAGGHFRIQRLVNKRIDLRLQMPPSNEATLTGPTLVEAGEWVQVVVNFGCKATCQNQLFVKGVHQATNSFLFSFEDAVNPLVFATDQGNAQQGDMTGTPSLYLTGALDEIVYCADWVNPEM